MPISAAALVVAAGRGTRISQDGTGLPKQYRPLCGRPILSHTLTALANHAAISSILTVIHPDDRDLFNQAARLVPAETAGKLLPPVHGGATRQNSVLNGLEALENTGSDFVLIHDAARPFVTGDVVDGILDALRAGKAGALAAIPVNDTLKRRSVGQDGLETVSRTGLHAAQTPQGFALGRILQAHRAAQAEGLSDFTDDTSLGEWDGMLISLSLGDPANFKITTASDLTRAQHLMKERNMGFAPDQLPPLSALCDVRTGIGYDVHAFEDGDAVILGGTAIPHTQKLKGHSDADVALHAITDATLGAIGDGDIGQHFPPSDPTWKGAASDRFQIDAVRRVAELGGRIAHIDVTIVCEAPRIGPYRDKIRASIADICKLPAARVSVKATTSERLGFTGRKEGIAALASVTVRLPLTDTE